MPSDQVSAMTPFIRELLESPECEDWCVGFTSELDENDWIQLIPSSVNISMENGKLKKDDICKLFENGGFSNQILDYDVNTFLTLKLDWEKSIISFSKLLDQLFIMHFSLDKEYDLECEIYEI